MPDICTYKECRSVAEKRCGKTAYLCDLHSQEWERNIDDPKAPVMKLLGTYARGTHKVRDFATSCPILAR